MFSVSSVVFAFSLTNFWYKSPLPFLGLTIGLRFLWNNILSLMMSGLEEIKESNKKDFILDLNALLYNYPLKYFEKLSGNKSSNPGAPQLPSGLPWDLPGFKLIKIILYFIGKKTDSLKEFGLISPETVEKGIKYPSSNLSVFSFPFSLIK